MISRQLAVLCTKLWPQPHRVTTISAYTMKEMRRNEVTLETNQRSLLDFAPGFEKIGALLSVTTMAENQRRTATTWSASTVQINSRTIAWNCLLYKGLRREQNSHQWEVEKLWKLKHQLTVMTLRLPPGIPLQSATTEPHAKIIEHFGTPCWDPANVGSVDGSEACTVFGDYRSL